MKKVKTKGKDVIVDITREDYEDAIAQGVDPEFALKPGRHVFRRGGFRERHPDFDSQKVEIKVRVELRLDLEVLNYFKEKAAKTEGDSYENQINNALRRFIESEQRQDYSQLLADEGFIAAVARRVEEHLAKHK